jgi:hypothetical protein
LKYHNDAVFSGQWSRLHNASSTVCYAIKIKVTISHCFIREEYMLILLCLHQDRL